MPRYRIIEPGTDPLEDYKPRPPSPFGLLQILFGVVGFVLLVFVGIGGAFAKASATPTPIVADESSKTANKLAQILPTATPEQPTATHTTAPTATNTPTPLIFPTATNTQTAIPITATPTALPPTATARVITVVQTVVVEIIVEKTVIVEATSVATKTPVPTNTPTPTQPARTYTLYFPVLLRNATFARYEIFKPPPPHYPTVEPQPYP